MSRLLEAWLCGKVTRGHLLDRQRKDSVAEHTWGVTMLAAKYLPEASAALLRYLILHDAGEKAVGDIPAHVGWEFPEVGAALRKREAEHVLHVLQGPHQQSDPSEGLTPAELQAAEVLDRAEFVLSCVYEKRLGNTFLHEEIARALGRTEQTIRAMPHGKLRQNMYVLQTDLILEVRRLSNDSD